MQRLRDFHYDSGSGQFSDYGLHTEDVELVWQETPQSDGQAPLVRICVVVRDLASWLAWSGHVT